MILSTSIQNCVNEYEIATKRSIHLKACCTSVSLEEKSKKKKKKKKGKKEDYSQVPMWQVQLSSWQKSDKSPSNASHQEITLFFKSSFHCLISKLLKIVLVSPLLCLTIGFWTHLYTSFIWKIPRKTKFELKHIQIRQTSEGQRTE